jgi:hypothetical protein
MPSDREVEAAAKAICGNGECQRGRLQGKPCIGPNDENIPCQATIDELILTGVYAQARAAREAAEMVREDKWLAAVSLLREAESEINTQASLAEGSYWFGNEVAGRIDQFLKTISDGPAKNRVRAETTKGDGLMAKINPRVTDNDKDEITVTLDGRELRGWSYANDDERRLKMQMAHEFAEGWFQAEARLRGGPAI